MTLPDGSSLAYTYDAAHRLTALQDNLGNRIAYTLDAMGNRTKEDVYDPSSALAQTRSRVYNALNRLAQDIGGTHPAAQITQYAYDAQGNLTSVTDPLNRVTAHAYDALNRLVTVTDPASGVTAFGYTPLDQLAAVTDPRSLTTTYTRNGLDELTQQVSPDSGTTHNTYDAAGNVLTSTDARGITATYAYDALNRVTSVSYPDQSIVYTYDQGANGKGRLSAMNDASGLTEWEYDPHGRVTVKRQTTTVTRSHPDYPPLAPVSYAFQYTYDNAGRLASIVSPSGRVLAYSHDAAGRLSAITLNGQPLVHEIQWHPFGRVTGWRWANGKSYARAFDRDGRVASFTVGAATRSVTYDPAGRITALTDAANPNLNQSYGYDALDRVTSYAGHATSFGYAYDAGGNMTQRSIGGNAYAHVTAPASNRLLSVSGPTPRSFAYDPAGNLVFDGALSITYDGAGRPRWAAKGAQTQSLQHNGLGQRVAATGNLAPMAAFLWDEMGRTWGAYFSWPVAISPEIRQFVFLDGLPIVELTPNRTFILYPDHLGAPRFLTDLSGDSSHDWTWHPEPFGSSGTSPGHDPWLRFPGQIAHTGLGLFYNYFRDYDPSTGRYIQSDPIGLDGGINAYLYAEANPLMYTDPLGLFSAADLPSIPQPVVDAVTGFGDAFLIPELVRDALDIDGGVNQCSAFYRGGKVTGFVWGSAPFALRGAAALGATRFGHALNHNRYLRIGPGRMPANGAGLPAGTGVPRMSVGPQIKGGPPNPHFDLRSRIPYAPPVGGPAECGCP